jgi:hypothetical protein
MRIFLEKTERVTYDNKTLMQIGTTFLQSDEPLPMHAFA